MSTRVLIYGSPILRKHSEELLESENLSELIDKLFNTLEVEGGIGLAAPQIGVLKRLFIMDTTRMEASNKPEDHFKRVVINPQILEVSQRETYYNEGCLSFPDLFEEVERPETIRVQYLDQEFKPVTRQIGGIEARIFQHEYDHLEGVLFVDRISSIKRTIITGKLKRLQRLSTKR